MVILEDGRVAKLVFNTLTDGSPVYDVILKPKRVICDDKRKAMVLYEAIERLLAGDYNAEEL